MDTLTETPQAPLRTLAWYHRIVLPDGTVTPGWAPIDPAAYPLPENLDGLRVLDVGAWDGYWTFECVQRGASAVVAIDDMSDPIEFVSKGRKECARSWETFDLCRNAFGYSADECERVTMSVYDVTPERLGMFDVVLMYGVVYHCRHPLLALERCASVCTQDIRLESAVLDDYSPYQGGAGFGYSGTQMVMESLTDVIIVLV